MSSWQRERERESIEYTKSSILTTTVSNNNYKEEKVLM